MMKLDYKEEWKLSEIGTLDAIIYSDLFVCAIDVRFNYILVFECVDYDNKLFYLIQMCHLKELNTLKNQFLYMMSISYLKEFINDNFNLP